MNRFTGLFVLAVLAIIAIPSCDYESEENLIMPAPKPDSAFYSLDIEPIISTNCAVQGCHLDVEVPLNTYSEVSGLADRIIARAVVERTMPVGAPPLSKSDRDKLQLWVDQGALNN